MAKYTPKSKEELKYLVQDESIYLGDIDTSNITDMLQLFAYTKRRDFSGIDSWDTSKVVDMCWMFHSAISFNENINSCDTSNVISMFGMFKGAERFNQPLDKWDTSSVVNMAEMFNGAKSFNQNIDSWNVSSVKVNEVIGSSGKNSMMFQDSSMENLPIWYSSKKMDYTELGKTTDTALSKSIIKHIEKDTQSNKYVPKTKKELWALCYDETISLGNIDTSNIVDMTGLFYGSKRRDFSGIDSWNTSNVVSMNAMFCGHKSFNEPLDKWDTSSVEFMARMFYGAESFNQNIDSWNVSSVCDNKEMFWDSGVSKLPKWYKKRTIAGNIVFIIEKRVGEVMMNPHSKKPKFQPQNKSQSNKVNDWSKIFGSSSKPALTGKSIFRTIGSTLFFVILAMAVINNIQKAIRDNSDTKSQPTQTQTTQQKQSQPTKSAQPKQNILRCDNKDLLNHLIKSYKEEWIKYYNSELNDISIWQEEYRKHGINLTSAEQYVNSQQYAITKTQTKSSDEVNKQIVCEAEIETTYPIFKEQMYDSIKYRVKLKGENNIEFAILEIKYVR